MAIRITGTGCYIPENVASNRDFLKHEFFKLMALHLQLKMSDYREVQSITQDIGRKYAKNHHNASDLATPLPKEP